MFPILALCRIDIVNQNTATIRLEQVEQESEECCLTSSVVANESQYVAIVDGQLLDVAGDGFALYQSASVTLLELLARTAGTWVVTTR